jgi:hypothetical protein
MKQFIYLQLIGLLGLFSLTAQAQNMSLTFNGTPNLTTSTSSISNDLGTNPITIEGWFYPESIVGATCMLIGDAYAGDNNIRLCILGDDGSQKLKASIFNGDWYTTGLSDITYNLNEWIHIAATYDGSNIRLYFNGVEVKSVAYSASIVASTTWWYFGRRWDDNTPDQRFTGKMDELRIWKKAKSTSQIRSQMCTELDPLSEPDLVGYFKLNEVSGTNLAVDAVHPGETGTNMWGFTGNPWSVSSAIFGPKHCLDLDGTDDHVIVSDNNNLDFGTGSFTVEGWISNDRAPASRSDLLLKHEGANTKELALLVINDKFWFYTYDGSESTVKSSTLMSTFGSNWVHFACVRDGGEMRLYLNGVLDASATKTALDLTNTGDLIIGQNPGNSHWDGKIEELRFWNDVRSEAEIRENMFKNLTGSEANLVAYYPFDNNSPSPVATNVANTDVGNATLTNMDPATDWVPSGAFNTWLNTNSDSFYTGSNWSRGSVPGSTDNMGIYNFSGSNPEKLTGPLSVNSLYSESGSGFATLGPQSLTSSSHVFFNSPIDFVGYHGNMTIGGDLHVGPLMYLGEGLNVSIGGDLVAAEDVIVSNNTTLSVTGDYSVPFEKQFTIYGTATIGGNFTSINGSITETFETTAVFNVNGNADLSGTTILYPSSKMNIGGNLTLGNGATFDAKNGDVIVGGGGN